MSDGIFQFGVSNLILSLGLAAIAWTVQSRWRRPSISHLLWLIVLLKLVTPPIVLVPVANFSGPDDAAAASTVAANETPEPAAPNDALAPIAISPPVSETQLSRIVDSTDFQTLFLILWAGGSVAVLVWSLVRVRRFDRLLRAASRPAPADVQDLAASIAQQLGSKRTPTINVTDAHFSPMVWWIGGRVSVHIPAEILAQLGPRRLRWVLGHELAHVHRHDHVVRWLEWSACVLFWWNPVAWIARRQLRANEEICCDALVLARLAPKPHDYADSLLSVAEFLTSPTHRPPAMASELDSGGFLERRFKMIISNAPIPTSPRWVHALTLVCAFLLLPIGVTFAQNGDPDAVAKRLRAAVKAGEVTEPQAERMMDAMKRHARPNHDALRRRLEEAVRLEEITAEQAEEMMKALELTDARRDRERARARTARETEAEAAARALEMRRDRLLDLTSSARDLADVERAQAAAASEAEARERLLHEQRMRERAELKEGVRARNGAVEESEPERQEPPRDIQEERAREDADRLLEHARIEDQIRREKARIESEADHIRSEIRRIESHRRVIEERAKSAEELRESLHRRRLALETAAANLHLHSAKYEAERRLVLDRLQSDKAKRQSGEEAEVEEIEEVEENEVVEPPAEEGEVPEDVETTWTTIKRG